MNAQNQNWVSAAGTLLTHRYSILNAGEVFRLLTETPEEPRALYVAQVFLGIQNNWVIDPYRLCFEDIHQDRLACFAGKRGYFWTEAALAWWEPFLGCAGPIYNKAWWAYWGELKAEKKRLKIRSFHPGMQDTARAVAMISGCPGHTFHDPYECLTSKQLADAHAVAALRPPLGWMGGAR